MKTALLHKSGNNNSWKSVRPPVASAMIFILLIGAFSASAALKTWVGLGANANWSTSLNWSPSGQPGNNDDVSFPAGAAQLLNTNNLASLKLSSIAFSGAGGGYLIRGNGITLTNGLTAAHTVGANTVDLNITNGAAQTITATTGGTLAVTGDLALNGFNLTVNNSTNVSLGGLISGSGNLSKNGTGKLLLNGAINNAYTGTTTVNAGTLELNDSASANAMVPGDLTINSSGTVLLTEGNQIADTADVTINGAGTLNLNGFDETIATLTFGGSGSVTTGVGTLTNGNITANGAASSPTISGNLHLGSSSRTFSVINANSTLIISAAIADGSSGGIPFLPADITKSGLGLLLFSGANTYGGPTTVNDGILQLNNNLALGRTFTPVPGSAATFVNSNAVLLLNNAHVTNEVLTLNSTNPNGALQDNSTADWAGNITLSTNVVIEASSAFGIEGTISGPGGFTKIGASTLTLRGTANNTYAGPTVVQAGILPLDKSASHSLNNSSSLTIGDDVGGVGADIVRYVNANGNQIQISVPITINSSGLLDLNGHSDDLGDLTFNGGHITTGAGTLNLNGNVTANANTNSQAIIDGQMSISSPWIFNTVGHHFSPDLIINAAISGVGGGITKNGVGELSLTASNSFSGLVTLNDGFVLVDNAFALGTTNSGTVVNTGAVLALRFGVDVAREALTLAGTGQSVFGALSSSFGSNSWAGNIVLADNTLITVESGDFLNLSGSISGPGSLTKSRTGTLIYSGGSANNYAGVTTVNAGTLVLAKSIGDAAMTNSLVIGDGSGGVNADVVRTEVTSQLPGTTRVTVNSSGLFEITQGENFGSLAGSGNVIANVLPSLGLAPGFDNSSTTFSGVISGTGDFYKEGSGTMTLSGNNTYTGSTRIAGGKLLVNGSQPQSPVIVGAVGILGGSGTVGNINNTVGGVVSPGSSPGILTSSNVVLSGASSDFTVELAGPFAGSGYDQLNVRGTNNLGGATLNVTAGFGLSNAPVAGDTFTILNNDAAEAITGTFAGLANGATFTADNLSFRINYNGGSGNDVVLTLTNVAAAEAGTAVSSGNGNATVDPNECNLINVAVSNKTASAMTGISAKLASLTPGVAVVQPFAAYPDIPGNSRGTNTSAFQVTTTTNLVCGQNIQLQLVLQTATHNSFAIPVVLTSGTPGSPLAFNNSTPTAIPDGGSLNSTIAVSGITAPIGKVTVTLFLTHPQDQDMDITLEAPDGTIVELTTDNGATSANYGTSCAAGTTFDDAAATAITAGAAPFSGTFRPEGKLSDFRGKSDSVANGIWTLHLVDDNFNGFAGSIQCWTINVSPATCEAGSGACELCPDVTITGAVGPGSPALSDRLLRTGSASVCGVASGCPGPFGGDGAYYEAYTFRNGPSSACITVTLTSAAADVFSAAYLGSLIPSDTCSNYLADSGSSTFLTGISVPSTYSFDVLANGVFVVEVNSIFGSTGPFTLQVSGGDCRPALNVTALPGNKALLDWTTAAAGYGLESTNVLVNGGSPLWPPISAVPTVINGRFNVTNNVTSSNQFYHLRKPLP